MSRIVIVEQGTDKWLEERKKGIGSSDISAVLGVSPFKKPIEVWMEKVSMTPSEKLDNEAIRWGNEHEDEARKFFEEVYNVKVEEVGLVIHGELDYVRCSPDGLIGEDTILEIKCPKSLEIPTEPDRHYLMQVQWQLLTTGRKLGYLLYYVPDGHRVFTINADPKLHERMLSEAEAFWKCVTDKEYPDEEIPDTILIQEGDEIEELTIEFASLYVQNKVSEKRLKEIKKELSDLALGKKMRGDYMTITPITSSRPDYKGACKDAGLEPKDGVPYVYYRMVPTKKGKEEFGG